MFGFRADGRRIGDIDPIVQITPYLMPMRCDAQVFLQHEVDYEMLTRYIAKKLREDQWDYKELSRLRELFHWQTLEG